MTPLQLSLVPPSVPLIASFMTSTLHYQFSLLKTVSNLGRGNCFETESYSIAQIIHEILPISIKVESFYLSLPSSEIMDVSHPSKIVFYFFFLLCWGLNPWPSWFKASTLPTELHPLTLLFIFLINCSWLLSFRVLSHFLLPLWQLLSFHKCWLALHFSLEM